MAAGVNTKIQQARLILTYFDGRAALAREAYYNKLDNSSTDHPQEELNSPQAVINYFKEYFEQPNSEISIRQRLIDLKQTGSLEDYISEKKKIVGSENIDGNFEIMLYFINDLEKISLKHTVFAVTKSEPQYEKMNIDALVARIKKQSKEIASFLIKKVYKPKIVFVAPTNNRAFINVNSQAEKIYF
ncbi:hypothetical protein BB561_003883 [Smittium simulii]|uniref:Retrotransposon gag domain-containing protein n=1 Tax=Smittium simulii TaxID=133385 RepID=A0A2T9YJ10_9FUNG|nr:hypothetical protein BB561_003883 [Smittium simulii]